jgi:RHS repeat-associated protein
VRWPGAPGCAAWDHDRGSWCSGLLLRRAPKTLGPGTLVRFRLEGKALLPKPGGGGRVRRGAGALVSPRCRTSAVGRAGHFPISLNTAHDLGLLCATLPAAQPTTAGLPQLPVTRASYNWRGQPVQTIETVVDADGSTSTRTSHVRYDMAGRTTRSWVSGGKGQTLPATETVYDQISGAPVETRSLNGDGTVSARVTRRYDAIGRLVGYTDAGDNTATASYDLRGHVVRVDDGKGVKTLTYDPLTGLPAQLVDSQAGTFTAEAYDADGNLTRSSAPGGILASTAYDPGGAAKTLSYWRDTGTCPAGPTAGGGDPCALLDFAVGESVHGQWITDTSELAARTYHYDPAGRLVRTNDLHPDAGCTVRDYTLDANTNRTRLQRFAPGVGGVCQTSTPALTLVHTYDAADRIGGGHHYDAFGRTITIPDAAAGGQTLTASYYVNDLVASLTQGEATQVFDLDPTGRIRRKTSTGAGLDRYAYAGDTDIPVWTDNNAIITRYITGIDGLLSATHTTGQGTKIQFANIHGDLVASLTPGQLELALAPATDEFGAPLPDPTSPSTDRYNWLGVHQRETILPSGMILMGARVYNPHTARFLQVDPVTGGSDNPYEYARGDSVNNLDLDGRCSWRARYKKCMDSYKRVNNAAKFLMSVSLTGLITTLVLTVSRKFLNYVSKNQRIAAALKGGNIYARQFNALKGSTEGSMGSACG